MKKIAMILVPFLVVILGSSANADPYADAVISYTEGPGVGDAEAEPPCGNDNPSAALGAPENDARSGCGLFVSLGNGGSIELAFTDNIIVDGDGYDLKVCEVGSPENGNVYVSDDCGGTWVLLGTADGTTSFDLTGTGLSWANAVKVVDLEPYPLPERFAGFDVDAVIALHSADFNVIEVDIDIKPGSYPNAINKNGNGVIPVAILGSADFDVTQIDVSTLSFAGLAVRVKGNDRPQCSFEDVSGDFLTPEGAPDGYLDLVCQFVDDTSSWIVGDGEATLIGLLLDGTLFEGTDSIKVVQ